jgi:DNA integrity scanning protein DisA with diadenylate cyclase activity
MDETVVSYYVAAVRGVVADRRGALLVVVEDADREAARLIFQATVIDPVRLTETQLRHMAAIDGALLFSPRGDCRAIGVILDGRACREENRARGSRFNSAVRYVNSAVERCFAVVVSEDGTVDVVMATPRGADTANGRRDFVGVPRPANDHGPPPAVANEGEKDS